MEQMLEEIVERVVRRVVPELLAAQTNAAVPEVLTVDQAAALANVHHSTVREWIKAGTLPATLAGKRRGIRVRRDHVLQRLERAPASTAPAEPSVDDVAASLMRRRRSA